MEVMKTSKHLANTICSTYIYTVHSIQVNCKECLFLELVFMFRNLWELWRFVAKLLVARSVSTSWFVSLYIWTASTGTVSLHMLGTYTLNAAAVIVPVCSKAPFMDIDDERRVHQSLIGLVCRSRKEPGAAILITFMLTKWIESSDWTVYSREHTTATS